MKEGVERKGNISSCCTGSSSLIDVSTARTLEPSSSCQRRWAEGTIPWQEEIQDKCDYCCPSSSTLLTDLDLLKVISDEGLLWLKERGGQNKFVLMLHDAF